MKNPYAFPSPQYDDVKEGMSLRDYFAAKAMQGLIADGHTMWDSQKFQGDRHTIAEWAYIMADAMLIARSKK